VFNKLIKSIPGVLSSSSQSESSSLEQIKFLFSNLFAFSRYNFLFSYLKFALSHSALQGD